MYYNDRFKINSLMNTEAILLILIMCPLFSEAITEIIILNQVNTLIQSRNISSFWIVLLVDQLLKILHKTYLKNWEYNMRLATKANMILDIVSIV